MDEILFNKLIEPIPGDELCGEDLSYSAEFDAIRTARREDDPALAQGEWKTELKVAQWSSVKQSCEQILQHKSKDLQVACWYTEALTKLQGFAGLTFGLQVLEVLVTDFWEFFYPPFVSNDLDERAGKIAWLNTQLALTVRHIPLTDRQFGAYSWLKWNESRETENIGLKNVEAKILAMANGKLSGEVFDKAASASGIKFYQTLFKHIQAACVAVESLEKHIDLRFQSESPGLTALRVAVSDCKDVVGKLLTQAGGKIEPDYDKSSREILPETTARTRHLGWFGSGASSAAGRSVGAIQNREDAIASLRQVSQYFKDNEPHSPVAMLAERAAKWAEMPLEEWLESVIKDSATLNQLRELLDVQRN